MTDKPTTPPDDLVSRTIKERSSIYGPPVESFDNIGLVFTAAIQQHYGIVLPHPIPGWLASIMLAHFKNQRACRVFHADNYVDGHAYLRFAEEGQRAAASGFEIKYGLWLSDKHNGDLYMVVSKPAEPIRLLEIETRKESEAWTYQIIHNAFTLASQEQVINLLFQTLFKQSPQEITKPPTQ